MTDSDTPKPALRPENNLVGKVLNNNYRLDRLIGAGGMGEVYEGEHLFTGNRVAIKAVLQSLSHDEKVLGLFKREARILFKLTDEAIARYLDSFHEPTVDRYCLVMDYIDGVPLSEMMAQGRALTPSEAGRLMRRMAVALDRAHRLEIVHRDLSPDNIMLRAGEVDQAVLIDFGIARSASMTEGTLHGQFAGKFKYVSPEQLGHFGGTVGPRTDIYGLGLLIAAALRGKALDMGSSIVEAVNARRTIPALDGVPPALAPLLAHMLEPDPVNRPADMAAVVAMIDDPRLVPQVYAAWGGAAAQGGGDERTVIAMPMPGTAATGSLPPGTMGLGGLQTSGLQTGGFGVAPAGTGMGTGMAAGAGGGTMAPPSAGFAASAPGLGSTGLGGTGLGTGAGSALGTGGFAGLPSSADSPAPAPRRGGMVWGGLAALVLAAAGAGSWFVLGGAQPGTDPAHDSASLDPADGTPATEGATASARDAAPPPPVAPPDTATREGFLAGFRAQVGCSFATRITAGGNSGKIAVLADAPDALPGLAEAYSKAFGATPAVIAQTVSPAQCPVLGLLRGLQGRKAEAPLIALDTDAVASGGSVIGRIAGLEGRTLWLFLVSGTGAVFDLTDRLELQPDGSALLAVALKSDTGTPEPQLIVALASPVPLVTAGTAAQGVQAADLIPAVVAEIATRQVSVGAQAAFLMLTP